MLRPVMIMSVEAGPRQVQDSLKEQAMLQDGGWFTMNDVPPPAGDSCTLLKTGTVLTGESLAKLSCLRRCFLQTEELYGLPYPIIDPRDWPPVVAATVGENGGVRFKQKMTLRGIEGVSLPGGYRLTGIRSLVDKDGKIVEITATMEKRIIEETRPAREHIFSYSTSTSTKEVTGEYGVLEGETEHRIAFEVMPTDGSETDHYVSYTCSLRIGKTGQEPSEVVLQQGEDMGEILNALRENISRPAPFPLENLNKVAGKRVVGA